MTTLQTSLAEKEDSLLKFQSLLKQDRDEHSLAAARMQEELKRLQNVLLTHQQAYKELDYHVARMHSGKTKKLSILD